MVDNVRELALKILYKMDKDNSYSNLLLNDTINKIRKEKDKKEKDKKETNKKEVNKNNENKNNENNNNRVNTKNNLDSRDIALISEIVYGVTTWKLTLDEIIKKHSELKLNKLSLWILNILRLSIYQIVFLDKIPKSAAVNEGVNLAKKYGNRGSIGFTNAVLRKITKKDYEDFYLIKDENKKLSFCYSMPLWIIEELKDEGFSYNKVEDFCKASILRPKVSIRVNRLKTSKEELKDILEKEGIKSEDGILEDFLILNKVSNLENLEAFKNGFFTVEDEVAGLSALVLEPKEQETLLDACSSPGGKTTYLAEIMKNKGEIFAFDVYEHRTKLVDENCKRLGINIVKTKVNDASCYNEEYKNKFDKILLDVPCLGIGVLKRKPDIKWQKKKEDIEEISKLQFEILDICSKYLKPGGEIVYSTCSVFRKENRDIIEKFLEKNSNFKLDNLYNILNEKIYNKDKFFIQFVDKENNGYLEVLQNEKTDGFFICKLRNIKEN